MSLVSAEQAAAALAAGYDWRAAVARVLSALLELECADVFAEPVPDTVSMGLAQPTAG